MADRDDRRDNKRLSWREVDAIRDKSRQRDRDPMAKQSSPAALNAQKSYKAALERAFASGRLDELAATLQRSSDPRPPMTGPPPSAPPPPKEASPASSASGAANGAQAAPHVEADTPPTPQPLPPPAALPRDPEREQRQKFLAKIKEAEGREPITRAVDAYLAKWPKLPDDFEVLTKALSYKGDERVTFCLEQLEAMVAKDKPKRGRTLVAQLRMLEDTHTDPEIRAHAARVRAKL